MDWVGVIMIVAVLLVGTVGGLMHRRREGQFRDLTAAKQRIAELGAERPARRPAPEAAASAATAAASATAAAVVRDPGPPPRALRVVKDTVTPDEREEPGAVSPSEAETSPLDQDLLDRLGVGPAQATLLQFSSAFCAPCRAVRRVSAEVAALLPGVQHVEVDAESHLNEVRELGIWRTPTLLLLDASGRVVKRATGVPSKPQLIAALADVLPTTG